MSIKLCAITTREMTMRCFFLDTLKYMSKHGFDVTIICEPSPLIEKIATPEINYIPMPMKSGIENPVRALKIIKQMISIFRSEKFDIVQYASTNAGLYASLAAKINRVPIRINCQWGLTYLGYSGISRQIFKFIEKMICAFSTCIQSDSMSNKFFAINEGIVPASKIEVIWNGSSTGVNTKKFTPEYKEKQRDITRRRLGISDDTVLFGYVGRLNKDKGIEELLSAFKQVEKSNTRSRLLLVGPQDDDKKFNDIMKSMIDDDDNIYYVGAQINVIDYYSAMDFFVLPSYREGIATVLLEASAMGIPIISSNINGSIDVVADGVNGFLCETKSVDSLLEAMLKMIDLTYEEYTVMSNQAHEYVVRNFDHNVLLQHIMEDRIFKYNEIYNRGK